MIYSLLRPLLFTLDPERAHKAALNAAASLGRMVTATNFEGQPVRLMGLDFPNRVGLAAGFDKNAAAVDGLGALGFGSIEIGTVTPRPQAGNPSPRIFRLSRHRALINRMGFPNEGAAAAVSRLGSRRFGGIVGVNIGKNAATPLENAVDDYLSGLRAVYAVADYVTVNVSSPNTRDLRSLQSSARLEPLLSTLLRERDALAQRTGRRVPLLVKIAPDLDAAALVEMAALLKAQNIDGVIATNTTVTRVGVESEPDASETGGLSGVPLATAARAVVQTLRANLGPRFPIIGAGGIDSPASALAMREAGADLVQLYTGLIFRGPGIVKRIARALA